jgi:D-amino-acid oxidase
VNDETVDKSVCQRFVDHIASYLDKVRLSPLMDIHIQHPDHALVVDPAIPEV